MDWDLWGPSCSQDVIEEDALNEKSCVQVLRVLISKADTEIEELEKDLVILQSELAWAENREWSEICSTSLREKINCLDISIQSLKNENEHDINVHVLMRREPAERIHEIIKVLLRRYFLEKDEQEQHPVFIIKQSSSDVQEHATNLSDEKKKLSDFDSNIINKEGGKESSTTIIERFTIFNSSLKPHGTKENCAETVKAANITIENSGTDTSNQESGCSSENKKFSYSCFKIIKEEVQHSSTPAPDIVILESSLKPEGNRGEVDEKAEPSSIAVEDFSLDALEHSNNNSDEKGKQCKLNIKDDPTVTDDYKILISSLKSGGKRKNYQKVVKPTNVIVENSNSDAVRCEIGLDGKKKSYKSISRSDVLTQTNSGGADVKPKISNFPLRTVQEKTVNGSKVAASNKIDFAKSSPRPDKKSMTVQEAVISDNEHPAVNSLSELQDHIGKDTTKLHPEEEGKPQAGKIQKAKTLANDQESILCPSLKSPKPKAKRKIQSNQLSVQEAGLPPTEGGLNSSSASKVKRRRKFGISKDNASLKQLLDVKILKNLVLQNSCEDDEPGLTPEVSENSVLLSQKRSKNSLKLPILKELEDSTTYNELPKLHADTTDGAGKEDLLIINSCSIDDSHDETIKSLPCPIPRRFSLEKMKLVDLRAMAKQHNMTKYHKLRKDALVQQIAKQLG
ncbi:hypothetical protein PVL29_011061 [Vitis rotundifolia]|uniref:Rho termination factor-like N-terminal domain-containing protein n=1 Tax=Vitis rotundifolia TaxID=103349 RepID=A0AA39DT04_VITRO|nr:hypothetical protein PVL29_011061 [Vitis rotundifolia]